MQWRRIKAERLMQKKDWEKFKCIPMVEACQLALLSLVLYMSCWVVKSIDFYLSYNEKGISASRFSFFFFFWGLRCTLVGPLPSRYFLFHYTSLKLLWHKMQIKQLVWTFTDFCCQLEDFNPFGQSLYCIKTSQMAQSNVHFQNINHLSWQR